LNQASSTPREGESPDEPLESNLDRAWEGESPDEPSS